MKLKIASNLKLSPHSRDVISNRESNSLEFKESFNFQSFPKYARTMAAFANNIGGTILFGIKNSPHKIVGINPNKFECIDPVKLTSFLNDYFSPEVQWDFGTFEFHGKYLGYLFVEEAIDKPIIATKSAGKDIRESSVYYRYRGKSSNIKYPELEKIIEHRLDTERKAWIQHLDRISRSGPTRIGILDTIEGKVHGPRSSFIIDESLLRQIKVIQQGKFSERSGAPTLRLIGDLKTTQGVTTEKSVPVGIHFDDLVTSFLAERDIDKDEAKSYLLECAHQTTHYVPILYFIFKADLSIEDVYSNLDNEKGSYTLTVSNLKKRIAGTIIPKPIGTILEDAFYQEYDYTNEAAILNILGSKSTASSQRTILFNALIKNPIAVRGIVSDIPNLRLIEALSHLKIEPLQKPEYKQEIFGIFLDIFNTRFSSYKGGTKSAFRKSISCIEESLYRDKINS